MVESASKKEPSKYLHWVIPMSVGIALSAGGFLISAGAYPQRITDLERRLEKNEKLIQAISDKLDHLATKDDVKGLKEDLQREGDLRDDKKRR